MTVNGHKFSQLWAALKSFLATPIEDKEGKIDCVNVVLEPDAFDLRRYYYREPLTADGQSWAELFECELKLEPANATFKGELYDAEPEEVIAFVEGHPGWTGARDAVIAASRIGTGPQ